MGLKLRNNTLLLIAVFLFLSPASADIKGGHSKQRLGLIFLSSLSDYYSTQPLSIHLRNLPIKVYDDGAEQTPLAPLLRILAQEDLLSTSTSLETLTLENNAQLQTRATTYFAIDNRDSIRAQLGDVRIEMLTEMKEIESVPNLDVQQRFNVSFRWSLTSEAEWIWASELNTIDTVRLLRSATLNSQIGSADFEFRDNQWRLSRIPDIYNSDVPGQP